MVSLVGLQLPDISLRASDGSSVNLARLTGRTVLFCYPYTGRPDHPNPPGWDDIPGAHGSTPQALAFSRLYRDFLKLDVNVFGLSFSTHAWQNDFANRNALPYLLLSDETRAFSNALQLQTFVAGNHDYLARRGLIVENGTIRHDMFPVTSPERHAAEMLVLLES